MCQPKNAKALLTLILLTIFLILTVCSCNVKETVSTSPTTTPTSSPTSSGSVEPGKTTPSGETLQPTPSDTNDNYQTEVPPEIKYFTVAQAIEIANKLNPGEVTTDRYYIRAKVSEITNSNYGAMNISDETGEIYVYGSYSADGSIGYAAMSEKPYKGDEICISALIQNYNGTPELKSVWIIEFKSAGLQIDESKYTEMSIENARNSAQASLVKLSGVVARITYANGKIPNGFIIVDNTSSIYVFDSQLASRVAIGNTVTIYGEKTWWILDTEKTNAEKFGYKGCCQITNAQLGSNDNKVSDFNTSWIEESTVKAIMETPVSNDISTVVYKVNALIKKAQGDGFVNYYINDLDGKTGSYTYTQCSGSDFDWLDEFDGKICTVYLTALNAKSTATGCNWRFLPVKVVDEGFTFDPDNAAKFAIEYYALSQFNSSYNADPAAELITSVSSELLGLDDVKLSYTSSNEKVAYIKDGIFHTAGNGSVTITISASYKTYKTYSQTVDIKVESASDIDFITVSQAIASPVAPMGDETKITVKGIVGPSLVNQQGGFYLIDETGVIAVKFNTATDISLVSPGDEIIITGRRDAYKAENGYPGQACITSATLEANLYGDNDYSVASFVKDKTFADVFALIRDVGTDYSTTVFTIETKITKVATNYSTNYYLTNPDNADEKITLYSASGNQYSWLEQYVDKTVKVEVALCNWNAKTPYKGCVLAVYGEDGNKTMNTLNFSK